VASGFRLAGRGLAIALTRLRFDGRQLRLSRRKRIVAGVLSWGFRCYGAGANRWRALQESAINAYPAKHLTQSGKPQQTCGQSGGDDVSTWRGSTLVAPIGAVGPYNVDRRKSLF
jgi:hypothetical protein